MAGQKLTELRGLVIRTRSLSPAQSEASDELMEKDYVHHQSDTAMAYPTLNLVDLLKNNEADELLRDLAAKSPPIRAYLRMNSTSPNVETFPDFWDPVDKRAPRRVSRRRSFSA
ncbi:uncharacterized protein PV06_09723 [Exophiala oligosperma]|uniref:Uncharacterized protein n=1 Tax=Exophiala oligosperma TaxID=215243 RepID=A0A0D2DT43_9EURO|nr:uncharacterized protein PV06_09723 [Exophiala oligosperma]KIW38779.1 hypothetical protein PV06_09723 [Exophiala oligosperma]